MCVALSGWELKEKWSTSSTLDSELTIGNLAGAKVEVTSKVPLHKTAKDIEGSVKATYGQKNWSLQTEFDGSKITSAAVFSWKNWLFGAKGNVDQNFKPGNHTLVTEVKLDDNTKGAVYVDNFDKLSGEWLHQVNSDVTYGVKGGFTFSQGPAKSSVFEVAGKYKYDDAVTLKAKVNIMTKALNLAYTHKVSDSLSYNASAVVSNQ